MSLSRVRRSQDVWIFRKFPRHVFCGGGQVGPELLLKRLRGEAIAWEQVAEKLRGRPQRCEKDSPQVVCATCGLCPATEFTIRELLKGPQRQCTACSNCRRCPTCTVAIPPGTSRCLWCAGYSICRSCGQEFLPPGNSQHAWCAACQKKHGTLWVCGRCTLAKPLRHFSQQRDWYAPTTLQQKRRRRCDACVQEERRRDHASHTVPTQETTPVQPAPHTTQPSPDAELRCCGCGPRTASHFSMSQLLLGDARRCARCLQVPRCSARGTAAVSRADAHNKKASVCAKPAASGIFRRRALMQRSSRTLVARTVLREVSTTSAGAALC